MAKSTKKKEYFSDKELACQHCGESNFDADFLKVLSAIRKECDFGFPISSGYRCPAHPIESRKTATGAHSTGKAVDIAVSGQKALEVIRVAQAHGIQRIGVQQSGSGRFIHLDACTEEDGFPTPAIWSY